MASRDELPPAQESSAKLKRLALSSQPALLPDSFHPLQDARHGWDHQRDVSKFRGFQGHLWRIPEDPAREKEFGESLLRSLRFEQTFQLPCRPMEASALPRE